MDISNTISRIFNPEYGKCLSFDEAYTESRGGHTVTFSKRSSSRFSLKTTAPYSMKFDPLPASKYASRFQIYNNFCT